MTLLLEGRTALVTGGTSGIGKACVERLRTEGMTVVFTGRNEMRGEAVAAATDGEFELEIRADRTWQPRPRASAGAGRDDREMSVAVCNIVAHSSGGA